MQKQSSSETLPNILSPTVPTDIGVQSQRSRIIAAMIASCAEKTYAGTTISDVVRGASISRTTFYKRFPDKRSCFDAALDYAIEVISTAASESYADEDSAPEAVRKAIAAVLEVMASRPELARLLVAEAVAVDPTISSRYRALIIPAIGGLWNNEQLPARMSAGLAFGRIQLLIFGQVAAGRAADLPAVHSEIVYLALAPFAGHEEALRQSRLSSEGTQPQPASAP
jgi:AcrR family transcriptional regulator